MPDRLSIVPWSGRATQGVSRRQLRGPGYVRVTRGVYAPAPLAGDHTARCRAALAAIPGAVVSHWSAAHLHGLPTAVGGLSRVHLSLPAARWASRRPELCTHAPSAPVDTVVVAGLHTTSTVRTWLDLAAHDAGLVELVMVGDAALRQWPGWGERAAAAVSAASGRRGVRRLRQALGLLDARAESAMESLVRVVLVAAGLQAPEVNHVVRDPSGRFVARVDLAWPVQRLALEYDGRQHMERRQWERDLRRREHLEELGWSVLVLTAADLADLDGVVRRVRRRLST